MDLYYANYCIHKRLFLTLTGNTVLVKFKSCRKSRTALSKISEVGRWIHLANTKPGDHFRLAIATARCRLVDCVQVEAQQVSKCIAATAVAACARARARMRRAHVYACAHAHPLLPPTFTRRDHACKRHIDVARQTTPGNDIGLFLASASFQARRPSPPSSPTAAVFAVVATSAELVHTRRARAIWSLTIDT